MFGNRLSRGFPWPGNVFREMDRLQDEMNRLLRTSRGPAEYPALNVWANADGVLVTAEAPGVKPEGIDISVSGATLTLKGERTAAPESLGKPHRIERMIGRFSRTIELPFTVDSSKVSAHCEDGVLEIALPRIEADKPRKIAVAVR